MLDKRFLVLLTLAVALTVAAPAVLAQYEEADTHNTYDTTVAPLVLPAADDFAPAPDTGGTATAPDKAAPGVGISAYVDVTEAMKAGVLTPSYRFSPAFALKAHVPLIWERKLNYWGYDATAGGLGDVTLDAEYTRYLGSPGTLLRFAGSVKLPTGDEEKTDTDEFDTEYSVPLGTGTTDFVLRGTYARSTAATGLVAGLLFRENTPYESTVDWGGGVTQTTKTTASSQLLASLFGRYRANETWWVHLGVTAMFLGDGKSETEYSDGSPTVDNGAEMGGTLLDLYPGVSYQVGKFSPYLGVRLPVSTSFNSDTRSTDRNTAFIFQLSYRPEKIAE